MSVFHDFFYYYHPNSYFKESPDTCPRSHSRAPGLHFFSLVESRFKEFEPKTCTGTGGLITKIHLVSIKSKFAKRSNTGLVLAKNKIFSCLCHQGNAPESKQSIRLPSQRECNFWIDKDRVLFLKIQMGITQCLLKISTSRHHIQRYSKLWSYYSHWFGQLSNPSTYWNWHSQMWMSKCN